MKTILAPSWILTTDHSASSYGQPVLVYRATGEAYGPSDIIILNGQVKGTAAMWATRLAAVKGGAAVDVAKQFAGG